MADYNESDELIDNGQFLLAAPTCHTGTTPTRKSVTLAKRSGRKPGNTQPWMQIVHLSTFTSPIITKLQTLLTLEFSLFTVD